MALNGSYTVNSDCAGTASITLSGFPASHWNLVVVNGGQEMMAIKRMRIGLSRSPFSSSCGRKMLGFDRHSSLYRKTLKASFPHDRWPATEITERDGSVRFVRRDGTDIHRIGCRLLRKAWDGSQLGASQVATRAARLPRCSLRALR